MWRGVVAGWRVLGFGEFKRGGFYRRAEGNHGIDEGNVMSEAGVLL